MLGRRRNEARYVCSTLCGTTGCCCGCDATEPTLLSWNAGGLRAYILHGPAQVQSRGVPRGSFDDVGRERWCGQRAAASCIVRPPPGPIWRPSNGPEGVKLSSRLHSNNNGRCMPDLAVTVAASSPNPHSGTASLSLHPCMASFCVDRADALPLPEQGGPAPRGHSFVALRAAYLGQKLTIT